MFVKNVQNLSELKKNELDNCNAVKTILMLIIVFYHSILFWGGNWFTMNPSQTSFFLTVLAKWLNSFHIYAFVLVSGYIYSFLRFEKNKYVNTVEFLLTKARRLLVPFAFVCIVWVIPVHVKFFGFDCFEIIKRYVLATSPAQLWFLWMLFGVFVLFRVLEYVASRVKIPMFFLCIAAFVIGCVGNNLLPDVFKMWTACMYLPMFGLGVLIRQRKSVCLKKFTPVFLPVVHAALFVITDYISNIETGFSQIYMPMLELLLHSVGAVMAFFVLQFLCAYIKDSKPVTFLAKHAMPVYLFHQQVIYFVVSALNGKAEIWCIAALSFLISLIVSVVISTVLSSFKVTRFCIGEK